MGKKDKELAENKKENDELHAKKKKWSVKRFILIFLQALCGTIIGICFFVYHLSAQVQVRVEEGGTYTESFVPSIKDILTPYFESDIYHKNLRANAASIIRYVTIREQMEIDGKYAKNKIINVGEFANRLSRSSYDGPEVSYYLDDLIRWGQRVYNDKGASSSYKFYTVGEYCDFFGLERNLEKFPDAESFDDPYTSFETLSNEFKTIDGKNIEAYVDNEADYQTIVSNVQKTISDLYINYIEYVKDSEIYKEGNTNVKYAIVMTKDNARTLYTNVSRINKGASDTKIKSVFSEFDQRIYAVPGNVYDPYPTEANTTPLVYDEIGDLVTQNYAYAYPEDTQIWIAIDEKLPVTDVFSTNKFALENTAKQIPWIVSLGAFSMVAFLALGVVIISGEKKLYAGEEGKKLLGRFEKIPLEIGVLSVTLLVMLLYFCESITINELDYRLSEDYWASFYSSGFLVFVDIVIALVFTYGFIRRIICKNLLEGSIYSLLSPFIKRFTIRLRRWGWRVYDSAGVAIRTWLGYILFLLFNVFLGCMIFFGEKPLLSFAALFAFDLIIGIMLFNRNWERKKIIDGIRAISGGEYDYKIDDIKVHGDNRDLAAAVNDIGKGLGKAVEISTKDEKLKADLITNVSHDIKTPLTSIINYVDLLKRENIEDERIRKYIRVLDEKSQRLKQLTFDLVEASKITSGNISIDLIRIDFCEFVKQAKGEFEDKFNEKNLNLVVNAPKEPIYIMADPRHMWRVIENLFNNVYKYAMPETRVYLDLVTLNEDDKRKVVFALKNISGQQLNIPADELTERFIRGDVSRSTEGSGLGLSIAKSLTNAQKGDFEIYLDGDLFKVTLTFDTCS